ncbi:MAG: cysteine desulfurase family protein [Labilithrix sp.]
MARPGTAYLDWNATTPPHPDVLEAMRVAAARGWANPSSVHAHGRAARALVEDARAAVARLAGTDARDVVFTAGGTEANNLAVRRVARGGRILTSRLEHPSVTRVVEALEREGKATVRWLSVTRTGVVDLEDLERALADGAALVTVQAVNHETGIVQPVAEVIRLAHAARASVHVDAIQAWGKLEVPGGWDTASIAPHKMRGPKGIGALASREGTKIDAVLLGGAQEKGIRPGTVDATLAAGFGAAAELAKSGPARWAALAPKRDRIEAALVGLGARSVSDKMPRAPHVVSTVWPGWTGAELVAALDLEGVSVSSGAACSAGTVEPSPVLLAMLGAEDAKRGLRLSMGDVTTEDEIAHAIDVFAHVIAR